jgi:hypothetical protein
LRSISVQVSTRSVAVVPSFADDVRDQHRDRLAEHRRFGLDAADAPAEHADAVDHRRVRVRAHDRVGIGAQRTVLLGAEHDACEVLQVHLMNNAGAGRYYLEIVEGLLAPLQERVAFPVALEFDLRVEIERIRGAVVVDLDRVVDDQFSRRQRVDVFGGTAELDDGITHGGEIDHGGYAGEVLQDDATRCEGDLGARVRLGVPVRERQDVVPGDITPVLVAQQVLEQDLEGVGQFRDVTVPDGVKTEDFVVIAAHCQCRARTEGVLHVCISGVLFLVQGQRPVGSRIIANAL